MLPVSMFKRKKRYEKVCCTFYSGDDHFYFLSGRETLLRNAHWEEETRLLQQDSIWLKRAPEAEILKSEGNGYDHFLTTIYLRTIQPIHCWLFLDAKTQSVCCLHHL